MFKLLIFVFVLMNSFTLSNDYFVALDLFNKKKIRQSIVHFKKVADDLNHEKRSDAMFNVSCNI